MLARVREVLCATLLLVACSDDDGFLNPDVGVDASELDVGTDASDAATDTATDASIDGAIVEICANDVDDDADGDIDCYDRDCIGDLDCDFGCGDFPEVPEWSPEDVGLRAVIIAEGLGAPVALTFGHDDRLYVVSQGAVPTDNVVRTVDIQTGELAVFSDGSTWPTPADLLTTILFDADGRFGARDLYVADKGTDGDDDSLLWRMSDDGSVELFVSGPGAGLDDIYGMTFSSIGSAYPEGLYLAGDTDSTATRDDWGVYASNGTGMAFSNITGIQGIVFDIDAIVGGGLIACRPAGGGFSGDDTISRIPPMGDVPTPIVGGLPGIHAIKIASGRGSFEAGIYAASWSSGQLFHVTAEGDVTPFAVGLTLTEFSGDMLAFSPDEHGLFLADRATGRVICVEPL